MGLTPPPEAEVEHPHHLSEMHLEFLEGIMNLDDLVSVESPMHYLPEQHGNGHYSEHDFEDESDSPIKTPIMSLTDQPPSPDSPDPWRLTNAVHMELQENAKLPTFHWTVDRSGSATTTTAVTTESKSLKPNMTEIFLSSESRDGRHSNYAHVGVGSQGPRVANLEACKKNSETDEPTPDEVKPCLSILMSLQDFDPTPLSELKRRHESQLLIVTTTTSPFSSTSSSGQYRPRQHPLPIPNISTSGDNHGHDVVADSVAVPLPKNHATDDNQPPVLPPPPMTTTATTVQCNNNNNASVLLASKPPPKHSAAHEVSKPALQNASEQHSQYGFGRKHVVPAVPAAAPRPSAKKNGSIFASNASSHSTDNCSQSRDGPPDPDDEEAGGNVAYERKKQRAKHARIKLNASIDQLSLAISLAGTQSKERADQLSKPSDSRTRKIIQDCVDTSEDAKKWDRPSFVGSAATLIHSLNAQCESLLRALQDERLSRHLEKNGVHNHHHHKKDGHTHATAATTTNGKHAHDYDTNNTVICTAANELDNNTKRQRLNGDTSMPFASVHRCEICARKDDHSLLGDLHSTTAENTVADSLVFTERTVMDRVASFLEPVSIVRCMRVSKTWKEWGVFSNDPLWQSLTVERFGYYNVRQWRAKLEDEEAGVTAPSTILYRKMDAANVMPQFRREGLVLLGESRLAGKVSAWTFIVERSNGETMRSVQRTPSMNGNGMFAAIPVVQLWTVIQNTGVHDEAVVIREQTMTVDASTRRRGEEMKEIEWDDRFRKRVLNLDGSVHKPLEPPKNRTSFYGELCRLRLFDAVVLETNIYAKGCTTTSKFIQRSNFTKVLVQIRDGTTVPLVIPFPRDASHLHP